MLHVHCHVKQVLSSSRPIVFAGSLANPRSKKAIEVLHLFLHVLYVNIYVKEEANSKVLKGHIHAT